MSESLTASEALQPKAEAARFAHPEWATTWSESVPEMLAASSHSDPLRSPSVWEEDIKVTDYPRRREKSQVKGGVTPNPDQSPKRTAEGRKSCSGRWGLGSLPGTRSEMGRGQKPLQSTAKQAVGSMGMNCETWKGEAMTT